jgi:hypothetical protein
MAQNPDVRFRMIDPPNNIRSTANPPTYTRTVKVIGESSHLTVKSYLMSMTPAVVATFHGILYRNDIQLTQTAYNHWTADIPYGQRQRADRGEWTWDFDTTGGSIHITNAKEERARYPAATAPNQKGAIAVDANEVRGVDIVIPAMKVNVQYRHPQGIMTLPHAKFLNSITGTVNSTPFLTFAPGEVLFLGARGADGTSSEANVSYQFAMSANAEGLTIGDVVNVNKKGWDVLWIRYKSDVVSIGGSNRPVQIPQFVYVDRVYEEINLAASLGFGG